MLSSVILLLVFHYFLGLLNLLEEVLDLLEELEGLLGLRLLPGHDIIRLVVHLLEVGLEFVLNDGRRRYLRTGRWLEGLNFDVLVTLVQLVCLHFLRLARVKLLSIHFATFILSVLRREQGRLLLARLGSESISKLSFFLVRVVIHGLAVSWDLLALQESKRVCLCVRIRQHRVQLHAIRPLLVGFF